MKVDDVNTQRCEVALQLLNEGRTLTFEAVNFFLSPDGYLNVDIDSSWWIGNANEARALVDLERAQCILAHLIHESPRFAEMIVGHPERFTLSYFDGRDSVLLGTFVNGEIIWQS
jgi:hypothetical protein